jgi:hypothetical protein
MIMNAEVSSSKPRTKLTRELSAARASYSRPKNVRSLSEATRRIKIRA